MGSELLKAEVEKSHNCAKFSRIPAKILNFESKTGKNKGYFYDFDAI